MNIYENADTAIKSMNRANLKDFDRLKLAKWDELSVIRRVTELYETISKRARRRFLEIAFEAYIVCLVECGISNRTAHSMAEEAITEDWLLDWLTEADDVTKYRFDTETDRKKQYLIEALGVSNDKDYDIEKALKYWTRQIGQYAIIAVDNARMQAFEDAGIARVMWVTEHDERVCEECGPRDGHIYDEDKVPPKPHWGCRCRLVPVRE